jgi:hypothetical protein
MIRVENTEIEESVTIFPNPFTEQLNISINSKASRNIRISLTNVSGKQVYAADHELLEGENQITINTVHLSPALYILNINGAEFLKAYSVIKLRL